MSEGFPVIRNIIATESISRNQPLPFAISAHKSLEKTSTHEDAWNAGNTKGRAVTSDTSRANYRTDHNKK